jgi:hypothetical protein
MSQRPSYFSNWESQEQTCTKCGWVGLGSEASEELFTGLVQVDCPQCDGRLFNVLMPTAEQIAEAAAAGQPQAVSMFMAAHDRDRYMLRRNYTLLRDGRDLPDLEGEVHDFYLTLADNHGTVWLVLALGTGSGEEDRIEAITDPRAIHSELVVFEDTEPVGRIAGVLRRRYGTQFRYLHTIRALLYLGGDDLKASSEIAAALGPHNPPILSARSPEA